MEYWDFYLDPLNIKLMLEMLCPFWSHFSIEKAVPSPVNRSSHAYSCKNIDGCSLRESHILGDLIYFRLLWWWCTSRKYCTLYQFGYTFSSNNMAFQSLFVSNGWTARQTDTRSVSRVYSRVENKARHALVLNLNLPSISVGIEGFRSSRKALQM